MSISVQDFIKEHQLTMSAQRVESRPDSFMTDKGMRHWLCIIKQEGKGNPELMTLFFSQGSAHTKAPNLAEVLDCMASDASSVENSRDFEEWCSEIGYDTDSRKAEATYNECKAQARHLERVIGRSALRQLVEEVERL